MTRSQAGQSPPGLHVFEPSETHQVIDGAAHVAHGEGLADARFDELEHGGIGRGHAGNLDTDIGDGAAGRRLILGRRGPHADRHDGRGGDQQPDRWPHQKACLFLTSSA